MKHCFNVQVVGKNLYNQDAERTPIPFGALDNRMGTSQKVVFDNDIPFPSARTPKSQFDPRRCTTAKHAAKD